MANRRYQNPTPRVLGGWWVIDIRRDVWEDGKIRRKHTRKRLCEASVSERTVLKLRDEHLRPLNQGLQGVGAATNFTAYVDGTYCTTYLPLLASSTQSRTNGVIKKYLKPALGKLSLSDLKPQSLQQYFTSFANSKLQLESVDKIRDVLASILATAHRNGLIVSNPIESVQLPRLRRGKRQKPYITPQQFAALVEMIPEPYATMVYVAVYTGLRVSEICALRWPNIGETEISIEERYCRGDWSVPKSESSQATIGVNQCVIDRLTRLKSLTVKVKAGYATRIYEASKNNAENLVFPSVRDGRPMRDNNILSRHIKPAARNLGLDFVNWRCLRTSHATWLKMAGADIKDAQAQMRHSRASTTLDIYQQFVPASQRKAVDRLSKLVN